MDRLYKSFSIATLAAVAAAFALAAVFVSLEIAVGVLVGGVLGLANLRGLIRNVQALDVQDPKQGKLMFAGGARMLMLLTVLAIIAFTGRVDLIGLLVGFTVAVLVMVAAGAAHMRRLVAEEPAQFIGPVTSKGPEISAGPDVPHNEPPKEAQ